MASESEVEEQLEDDRDLVRSIAWELFLRVVYTVLIVLFIWIALRRYKEEFTNPNVAIIIGKMNRETYSMTVFMMKQLKELDYALSVFATEDGIARPFWEELGGPVSIFNDKNYCLVDWSIFEVIIASTLEAMKVIPSILQDRFLSIPLVLIIGEASEDTLAQRFPLCVNGGWQNRILEWRISIWRADMILFSNSSPQMLYNMLEIDYFVVKHGSPVDTWSVAYRTTLAKYILALECLIEGAQLAERVVYFPSDVFLLLEGKGRVRMKGEWNFLVNELVEDDMKLSTSETDNYDEDNSIEDDVDATSESEMFDDDDDDDGGEEMDGEIQVV